MAGSLRDAYEALGVAPGASDDEVRAAYRRLALRHHPDHNGGSDESARRFAAVQDAYARVTASRRAGAAGAPPPKPPPPKPPRNPPPPHTPPPPDPDVELRIAELERQLAEARAARDRAQRAAREAAAATDAERPSDEELGYVSTEDTFGSILADAADELRTRFAGARESPLAKRISDLIDELDGHDRR